MLTPDLRAGILKLFDDVQSEMLRHDECDRHITVSNCWVDTTFKIEKDGEEQSDKSSAQRDSKV